MVGEDQALKTAKGYSEEEIECKRLAVGVLVLVTAGWNEELLRIAGSGKWIVSGGG